MIAVRATIFLLKCVTLSSFVGLAVAAGVHYGTPLAPPAPQTTSNFQLSVQVPVQLSFTFTNTQEKNRWVPLTKDAPESAEQQEIIASRYDRGAFALLQSNAALVTYNDGESFEELRCQATSKPLKAAFSDEYQLFILCDDHSLLMHTPQQTTIQELPFTQDPTLFLVNQTQLVWISQTEDGELFARSSNNGETWESSPQDYTLGNDHNVASLSESGLLQLIAGSEAGCGGGGQKRFSRGPKQGAWTTQPWPLDSPSNFAIGSSGWSYALDWTYEEGESIERLMALAPNKEEAEIVLSTKNNENTWSIASSINRDLLQWDNALYSLQRGSAKLMTKNLPEEFTLMAVDADGNALGFFRGNLARFSEELGWQLLAQK